MRATRVADIAIHGEAFSGSGIETGKLELASAIRCRATPSEISLSMMLLLSFGGAGDLLTHYDDDPVSDHVKWTAPIFCSFGVLGPGATGLLLSVVQLVELKYSLMMGQLFGAEGRCNENCIIK
jgi:hypothetical protein